jgi:hypothetical protein
MSCGTETVRAGGQGRAQRTFRPPFYLLVAWQIARERSILRSPTAEARRGLIWLCASFVYPWAGASGRQAHILKEI